MSTIQYPRNRRASFIRLGLFVFSFAASFWWTIKLAQILEHYTGWSPTLCGKIGMGIWIAHMFGGAAYFIYYGAKFKEDTAKDFLNVSKFPLITHADERWLRENCAEDTFTVHITEGVWVRGENDRRPPNLFVEFHNEDTRVLFTVARPPFATQRAKVRKLISV